MSTFEIIHSDGRINRMRLFGDTSDPAAEVAKWPESDRATVVEIRPVDGFEERVQVAPPARRQTVQLADANQIATGAAQYTDIPECTVAELAGLTVNHAMVSDARGPNDDAGKGTGMYCVRIGGVWKTTVGTPVSA